MNLGTGFLVSVPNAKTEKLLFKVFEQRKRNYPIIWDQSSLFSRLLKIYPKKYLISSLDGCFATFARKEDYPPFDSEIISGLVVILLNEGGLGGKGEENAKS